MSVLTNLLGRLKTRTGAEAPFLILAYAALKGRSSTVVRAFS